MFERGKKDEGEPQAAFQQHSQATTAAAPAAARRPNPGQFAVIGRSIQINGDVKGDEDLMIEGDVSGTVELRNNSLTVGKEGKIKATMYARSITIDGTTDGDLFASERIAVRATANVRGNLLAPKISLEDGARFQGTIEMDPQAVEKALGGTQARPVSRSDSPASKGNSESKAMSGHATTAGLPG